MTQYKVFFVGSLTWTDPYPPLAAKMPSKKKGNKKKGSKKQKQQKQQQQQQQQQMVIVMVMVAGFLCSWRRMVMIKYIPVTVL